MTVFDQIMFSVFNYYRRNYKHKANTIAIIYITLLECSIIFFLGVLTSRFFKQMYINTISSESAWILFGLTIVFLYVKNWIKYSGKKRRVLNAKNTKHKTRGYNIFALWLLIPVIITLSIVILNT